MRKRAGLTSFEALGEIKRALGTGKVGHTGTLDKFAEGLLVVLAGRALKLSPWFLHCDKQYEGTIRFGAETATLDPEGEIVAEAPLPSREDVERVLPEFSGAIMQSPPEYSAVHIGGKRASALARSGETPQMEKRPVQVYQLELRSWEPPCANIFVHCSSGTYIRSLARDIARAAGSRAHLTALLRTRVAGFKLEDACNASAACDVGAGEPPVLQAITPAVFERLGIPWLAVEPREVEQIVHGKPLAPLLAGKDFRAPAPPPLEVGVPSPATLGLFCGGAFVAVVEHSGGDWKYGYVYAG